VLSDDVADTRLLFRLSCKGEPCYSLPRSDDPEWIKANISPPYTTPSCSTGANIDHGITILRDRQARAALFKSRGAVVVPKLETDVDAMKAAFVEMMASEQLGPRTSENPRLSLEADGSQQVRKVEPFLDVAPPALSVRLLERAKAAVTVLLGEEVCLFEDKANCKGAHTGSAFPWHQDLFYWCAPMASRDYPSEIVTVYIAVDDATAENGCLELAVTSTGHAVLQPHVVGPVDGGGDDYQIIESSELVGVLMPLSAGDALVFSSLVPHRSSVNRSGSDRRGILLSFCPARTGNFYDTKMLDDGGGGEAVRASVAYRERGELPAQAPAHVRNL
jgi:ectoine hydroxylase-related dioxygenase (phytanoyl-CoA dioxygenase family)